MDSIADDNEFRNLDCSLPLSYWDDLRKEECPDTGGNNGRLTFSTWHYARHVT